MPGAKRAEQVVILRQHGDALLMMFSSERSLSQRRAMPKNMVFAATPAVWQLPRAFWIFSSPCAVAKIDGMPSLVMSSMAASTPSRVPAKRISMITS